MNVANLFNSAQSLLCGNRVYYAVPKKSATVTFTEKYLDPVCSFLDRESCWWCLSFTRYVNTLRHTTCPYKLILTLISLPLLSPSNHIYLHVRLLFPRPSTCHMVHSLSDYQATESVCHFFSFRYNVHGLITKDSLFILYTNIYRSILWLLG